MNKLYLKASLNSVIIFGLLSSVTTLHAYQDGSWNNNRRNNFQTSGYQSNDYQNNYQETDNQRDNIENSQQYNGNESNNDLKNNSDQLMEEIQRVIKNSYKTFNINIGISDGIVTLSGLVGSEEDKKNIESDVSRFQGVKKVENKLEVTNFKPDHNTSYNERGW